MHAAPAKWMVDRKDVDQDVKKQGEVLLERMRGVVARVSAAGYGVIKNHNWGEVMWRQYELPTNLRSMQFANADRFQKEVQSRADYQRLKDMEGEDVAAERRRKSRLRRPREAPAAAVERRRAAGTLRVVRQPRRRIRRAADLRREHGRSRREGARHPAALGRRVGVLARRPGLRRPKGGAGGREPRARWGLGWEGRRGHSG